MAYSINANTMIQDFIINKIQADEWKAGDRIWTEQELCDCLGVSRVAVREAISVLCGLKILQKKQGSGTYVLPPGDRTLLGQQLFKMTPQEVIWLMEMRAFFDENCVRLFLNNATDEDVKELEESYKRMIANLNEPAEFNRYADEFHRIIARGTKNPFIARVSEFLDGYLHKHQEVLEASTGRDVGTIYHFKILNAIKERNVEFAALYMRYHIELGLERFEESIGKRHGKKSARPKRKIYL